MRLRGWVELEGAANARDLGGLPLDGGGVTASGILLRSDNLQGLTAGDVAELVDRRGLALVVDLRSGEEVRLEGPGPLVGRVEIRYRSVYPEEGQRTDIVVTDDVDYYLGYLRDRPDSIVGALEDVAASDGAVLVHCAAGKDRTGVVVALALAAAGVTREAIVADYVATHERVGAILARLKASPTYAPDLEGVDPDSRAPRAATMHALFAALDDEHGGPLGWLRSHGFDPRALRARLHQREHPAR